MRLMIDLMIQSLMQNSVIIDDVTGSCSGFRVVKDHELGGNFTDCIWLSWGEGRATVK